MSEESRLRRAAGHQNQCRQQRLPKETFPSALPAVTSRFYSHRASVVSRLWTGGGYCASKAVHSCVCWSACFRAMSAHAAPRSWSAAPAAAALPLLKDAATNTVSDWPALPQFPPSFALASTGPGSAYVVARAALDAFACAAKQANVSKPEDCSSGDAATGCETSGYESSNDDAAPLPPPHRPHATAPARNAGAAPAQGQSLAGAAGVPRSFVVPPDGSDSSSEDEHVELYRKYGVLQPAEVGVNRAGNHR